MFSWYFNTIIDVRYIYDFDLPYNWNIPIILYFFESILLPVHATS